LANSSPGFKQNPSADLSFSGYRPARGHEHSNRKLDNFRAQVGDDPSQMDFWARVRRAQSLLENDPISGRTSAQNPVLGQHPCAAGTLLLL